MGAGAGAAGIGQDVSQDPQAASWAKQHLPGLPARVYTQKKSYRYKERDPDKQTAFKQLLESLTPEQCVYIDEAGVKNTLDYEYAWSPKGARCYAKRLGHFTKVLLPKLCPGQTVIVDNAPFHREAKLKALLEPLGCRLLALPPYSPDLNKIEPLWHQLKSTIRHNAVPKTSFHGKVNDAFCISRG